jgi:hypothetical protein
MTHSRAPVLVALLTIAGCGAPPTPAPTSAPEAIPSAVPVTPPSAAPSAAPQVAQAPIDPGADRDKLALVKSLCAAAIKHGDGKVRVGCRACPPFDGAAGPPDGTVAIDPADFYPLELAVPGAFSKKGATEIAAVFQGCESHAENYGGTLLVEKTATGYRAGAYHSGVHPESCQAFRRADGRDLLVCQWSDAHQSMGFTRLFAFDFTLATADDVEKGWNDLVNVRDTSFQLCMGIDEKAGVDQGRVVGFRFEDRNGDGRLDLVVDVEHRHTAGSAALTAKIARACKAATPKDDEAPTVDAATLLGKPEKATLELLFDGASFKPTPATARLLKGL